MAADRTSAAPRHTPDPRLPVRARDILRVRAVWAMPLVLGSVVVALMTALYIGSVVNPLGHLHGLPVAIVNQDRGATAAGRHLDVGQQIETGLTTTPAVSDRLHLEVTSLAHAQEVMGRADVYATVVIPPGFTGNLLTGAGLAPSARSTASAPTVAIVTNPQAGTLGVSLATGVLQPALAVASHQIGQQLSAALPSGSRPAATQLFLDHPVTVASTNYRALPSHSALGLSAF